MKIDFQRLFGRLMTLVASLVHPLISAVPKWWYGALIPEWPGFFANDPKSIARYVSPKASQWIPVVTARQKLVQPRARLKSLRNRQDEIRRAPEGASGEVANEAADLVVKIEAVRREMRPIRRGMVETIYRTLCELNPKIRYVLDPYNAVRAQQTIRTPGEILESLRQGTCIDLAALFAGLCVGQKLLPVVILVYLKPSGERHALVAISLDDDFEGWDSVDRYGQATIAANELIKAPARGKPAAIASYIEDNLYVAIECTGFARLDEAPADAGRVDGLLPFEEAARQGAVRLGAPNQLIAAIDVATAQNGWGLAPYEPRQVFGERRLARIRRQRNAVAAAVLVAIAGLSYGYNVTYRAAKELQDQIVEVGPAKIHDIAKRNWVVRSWASGGLVDMLANALAPGDWPTSKVARERANAALGVLSLSKNSDPSAVLEVFGGPMWYHPQSRTYAIKDLARLNISSDAIAGWLKLKEATGSPRVRQAIVLAIGNCEGSPSQSLVGLLQDLFLHDDDPGVHSAADWALRRRWPDGANPWLAKEVAKLRCEGIGRLKTRRLDRRSRQWFVDSTTGLTMVYFPAAPDKSQPPAKGSDAWFFEVGRLDSDGRGVDPMAGDRTSTPTKVPAQLSRGFALATTEMPWKYAYLLIEKTVGARSQGEPATAVVTTETPRKVLGDLISRTARIRSPEMPATTSWREATLICNAMNAPGVTASYLEDHQGEILYTKLTGLPFPDSSYRLPSEVEWEYAARGFSLDRYCFGTDAGSLSAYGTSGDGMLPITSLMPNDFGLFDVHGGVEEWCNDEAIFRDPKPFEKDRRLDSDRPLVGFSAPLSVKRICRGGSRGTKQLAELMVYARQPYSQMIANQGNVQGFRLAISLHDPVWWSSPATGSGAGH